MKILAIDIGTGTQDILFFDTSRQPENSLKLVMPSPTVIVGERIARHRSHERLLLVGTTMGGGPSTWAVERRRDAGLQTFATAEAARTFNDDLEAVQRDLKVTLVSEEEAEALAKRSDTAVVALRDLMLGAIERTLGAYDVPFDFDLLAVAVFDHGNAPPEESDRAFRFAFLRERLALGQGLPGFAFRRDAIPPIMTRMAAVARSAPDQWPLLMMDTAPAAVLGALEDPRVASHELKVIANVGNFHTLAFAMAGSRIGGLFEHHTGMLERADLERLIVRLAEGTLTNAELFDHHGHGALVREALPGALDFVAVTGPRRGLLRGTHLRPYFAVPHGDMMQAGCFGLVRAAATCFPEFAPELEEALEP